MSELDDWYLQHELHLARGAEQLQMALDQFVEDWAGDYRFRVERSAFVRVKSLERILEKCQRKQITTIEELLTVPYPVRDIIGGRLVFRSLQDADACRRAVEDNFPLRVLQIDDKTNNPTVTGYRAIHVDGELSVTVKATEVKLPFELQIKTFAQDSWGYYTHDEAYSRSDINSDARFSRIRELQRAMANQLHAIDELQATIERLSEEVVHRITQEPLTNEVTYGNVLNLVNSVYGDILPAQDAQALIDVARRLQIRTIDELRELIEVDDASAEAAIVVDRWQSTHNGMRPTRAEFLSSVLESRSGNRGSESDPNTQSNAEQAGNV